MRFTILIVSLLYGLAALLLVLAAGSTPKRSRLDKERPADKSEWLYSDFLNKLYDAVLGGRDPVRVIQALGLAYDRYMVDCAVINRTPNLKREAMLRILGVFFFCLGLILSVPLLSPFPLLAGAMTYLLCASYIPRKTHNAAAMKKVTLQAEMSRFVDLLLSALEINLPVEIAIAQTAESVPCILSDELRRSLAETRMGAKSWQRALEEIAAKYEVDQLSDFVLDVITAYNKGVSVTEAVARKSYEIKQSALLLAKEKTAKTSNIILVPVTIFKIIPLMAVMMIPIVSQILTMFLYQ